MRNQEKKTEMVGFKTTPTIKRKLEEIAEREDRTISNVINRIITEYFAKEEGQAKTQ